MKCKFLQKVLILAVVLNLNVLNITGQVPVTPDASPEARALLNYLYSIYGKKTLSGQMWAPWGNDEIKTVYEITGKYPAIRGMDYIHEKANKHENELAIEWWKAGGIPTIMWHWGAPSKGEGYEQSKMTIDIDRCFEPGTEEYKAMWSDLKRIADHLTELRDANVPILWRPMHECDGNWFWYGKGGGERFVKLWKIMFDYFTRERKLNNLIWVLCHTGDPSANWDPGKDYYDLAGGDTYGKGIQATLFNKLKAIHGETIPIPYHECGTIPDPDECFKNNITWSWWMLWHTSHLTNHNKDELIRIYNHDLILTRDELPNIMDYLNVKKEISKPLTMRQMEYLDRGVVAIRTAGDSVYTGWRMLGTEPGEIAFNLYRQSGNGKPVRLNKKPITGSTDYTDGSADLKTDNTYFVKAVLKGTKQEISKSFTLKANSPVQQYINIPLRTPPGYTPNDLSAGDLDADGEYELILHQTGRSIDTPSTGISGIPIFQAYKMDGTFLWEINLGRNIREGAHYTQFMVFDLDGDGISEFACKTADGTIDGIGKVIGDSTKDWRNQNRASGPFYGKILDGPEYFTIFSGSTGEALATANYIPDRYPLNGWNGHGGNGGGDSTGNRVDRMLACVAYLDGVHPSVIMCRGYYGRSVLAAWDWRDGKLTSRWVFDSKDGDNPYSGQGNHNLSVTDVDDDGKDEIIYGSMVVDDNGKGLFTTGFRHGDVIHVGDFDPARPGLLVFGAHEIETDITGPGVSVYDARNGEVLFKGSLNKDVGRGVAGDIYPANPGAEMWWSGSGGLFNMKGEMIGESPSSTNFLIWWDGDLSRELLDGNHIDKYKTGRIFTAEGCVSNNGSKSTPALSADLFGDWREEVIFRTTDNQNLRIYTTTIPANHRIYTLMHNPQYRLAVATQNVAYNQPPNTSFFLGTDMKKAPKPDITLVRKGVKPDAR
jgi:rhamnogalacturonan endolyase